MYQFSGKLKSIAIALMLIGALGIGYGFFVGNSKTIDDAKEVIAQHDAHAEETATTHTETTHEAVDAHADNTDHQAHEEHVLHQLKNRPWAAFFVSLFFFFMIALLIFAFYAIQIAASAGWSVVLFRVMEALSVNLIPLGILMFLFLLAAGMGLNHFYPWMHAEGDAIIEGKKFWLNTPGWLIRSAVYIIGFIFFRFIILKKSRQQDDATDRVAHEKGFKYVIFFLAFFMLAESALSWDWIMSLDPHWFSSLFGWYIFASAIVSAITVIAMVTMYLKSKGYLEFVNDSHLHDLAKYMFGFSIFWTYLWFAQYMLIWYSNMPEETTYYMQRIQDYNFIFYLMIPLNFVLPTVILMDTAWKRVYPIVILVGLIILVGHYIDMFVMIMPSSVGAQWSFGIPEIGALLFFIGLFIFCGFRSLAKQPLLAKGNPYLEESKHYHY